ncbi:MAG: response regulator [Alphaproteobacteria bacterium]|nr:response regulator [Alphaproteobacteria bacterium]
MKNSQLGKLQILVVDDEKTILRLICDVLIQLGFKDAVIATSGRKAIELLAKQKFDFIITDWRMNDLDGIDLVRFVRSSPESAYPTIPIIMLTGNAEAHYVMTARNAGINAYLIKPFSASQLVRRIRQIIEQPREFVLAPAFRGPDRRHRDEPPPPDLERRKPRKKSSSQ